jgi:hypothetical protein
MESHISNTHFVPPPPPPQKRARTNAPNSPYPHTLCRPLYTGRAYTQSGTQTHNFSVDQTLDTTSTKSALISTKLAHYSDGMVGSGGPPVDHDNVFVELTCLGRQCEPGADTRIQSQFFVAQRRKLTLWHSGGN